METLERWLRERSLVVSLLLALGLCWALGTDGVVSEDVMPVGDGEHYVLRGMTLYGYLHSGQWSRFWDVFTLPGQSLAPLHYWLFFLLPQGWASVTSYGVVQGIGTYALLALGGWKLCRVFDRMEWTPALFLFCAAQNISLDYSFFYFMDVPFMALGTLALAWQIGAWRQPGWRSSLLSGVGAGLMFWVKAPNALLFTATYLLAEVVRLGLEWRGAKKEERPALRKNLIRHGIAVAAGYIPVTLAALACGGFQSIIRLIDANEVSGLFSTTLECTGLLRFFYFPLCLTFFYHTVMLLVIFGGISLVAFQMNRGKKIAEATQEPAAAFPVGLLLPVLAAYFVLGEVFSFGMENKEMRSLLLMLPIFWLSVFWILERWQVRTGLVFVAAVIYLCGAFCQVFWNGFESKGVYSEGYQLKGDWLFRLPQPHPASLAEIGLTRALLGMIHQALPDGGKVAIGTEQLYVTSESLTWCLEHDLALHGQDVPCEFNNFLTNNGRYSRKALLNARGILVFVAPQLQYTREVYDGSIALLQFVAKTWVPQGLAGVMPLQPPGADPMGYLVVMKEPLTDAQITQLIEGTNATELPANNAFDATVDQRLTWPESMDILRRWEQKRLGGTVP